MKPSPICEQDARRLYGLKSIPAPALILILAWLMFLPACSGNGAKGSGAPPAMGMTVPVTVAGVTQQTIPVEVRVIGNVEAYSTVTVRSQIDGEVDRVYFQEGRDVNAGDLLFPVDSRPYQARLQQAEATLARDIAHFVSALLQPDEGARLRTC